MVFLDERHIAVSSTLVPGTLRHHGILIFDVDREQDIIASWSRVIHDAVMVLDLPKLAIHTRYRGIRLECRLPPQITQESERHEEVFFRDPSLGQTILVIQADVLKHDYDTKIVVRLESIYALLRSSLPRRDIYPSSAARVVPWQMWSRFADIRSFKWATAPTTAFATTRLMMHTTSFPGPPDFVVYDYETRTSIHQHLLIPLAEDDGASPVLGAEENHGDVGIWEDCMVGKIPYRCHLWLDADLKVQPFRQDRVCFGEDFVIIDRRNPCV